MKYLSVYKDFFGKFLMLKLSDNWRLIVRIPPEFNEIINAEFSVEDGEIYIDIEYDGGNDVINVREWCDTLNLNYEEVFDLLANNMALKRGV